MTPRVRHCVECPKCLTRYLVGFSPYRNGSYLMPLSVGFSEEWTLYCSCGRLPISSRWNWNELKLYAVSNQATTIWTAALRAGWEECEEESGGRGRWMGRSPGGKRRAQ